MGIYRGIDQDEGWINRRFDEVLRVICEKTDRLSMRSAASTIDVIGNGFTLPADSFAQATSLTVDVPTGYNTALVQVSLVASVLVSGSVTDSSRYATIGVQSRVTSGTATQAGQINYNGRNGGGVLSVSAGGSIRLPVSGSVTVAANAYKSGTGTTANQDEVNLAVTVLFTRE